MRGSTAKRVANLQPRKSKCCDCILIVSSNFFIFLICSVFTLIEMSWKLIAINLVILKVTMVFCWKV